MTALIHLDEDFSTVYSIQAINEPVSDASKTPGLDTYYVNFVKVVRSVELALGVTCPTMGDLSLALNVGHLAGASNVTAGQSTSASATPTSLYRRGGLPAPTNKTPKSRASHASASPAPPLTPSLGADLPSIIFAQKTLDDAINVKDLQKLMADTLVAVGIDPTSSPAANLFSGVPPVSSSSASASSAAASGSGMAKVSRRAHGELARRLQAKRAAGHGATCIETVCVSSLLIVAALTLVQLSRSVVAGWPGRQRGERGHGPAELRPGARDVALPDDVADSPRAASVLQARSLPDLNDRLLIPTAALAASRMRTSSRI
jgi:hypothetical protein